MQRITTGATASAVFQHTDPSTSTPCDIRDSQDLDHEGYPTKARRRLTAEDADGTVVDIDTSQTFKVMKIEGGFKRIVPRFEGRVNWKSAKGFAAMRLVLSCLGAEGEYVLWDDVADVEMTERVWIERKFYTKKNPPVRHCVCGEVVTSTSINHLQCGKIGCNCRKTMARHWRNRRAEVVAMGVERGFVVRTTEKEWVEKCDGNTYCPTFECVECVEVVTSTCIASLQQGQSIGCTCNSKHANRWRDRRAEVVAMGVERGFVVLTTEEEWVEKCDANTYCPTLECGECAEVVTSTSINSLQRGQSIGCSCHKKTERLLQQWLRKKYPEAIVATEYRGPGRTHFDFHMAFENGFEVLVELDGPQHFWVGDWQYTLEGCERDLVKEEWANSKGLSVVRVLQDDVWNDRYGWDRYLTVSIEGARSGKSRVVTPEDTREYRCVESMYVQLRRKQIV